MKYLFSFLLLISTQLGNAQNQEYYVDSLKQLHLELFRMWLFTDGEVDSSLATEWVRYQTEKYESAPNLQKRCWDGKQFWKYSPCAFAGMQDTMVFVPPFTSFDGFIDWRINSNRQKYMKLDID